MRKRELARGATVAGRRGTPRPLRLRGDHLPAPSHSPAGGGAGRTSRVGPQLVSLSPAPPWRPTTTAPPPGPPPPLAARRRRPPLPPPSALGDTQRGARRTAAAAGARNPTARARGAGRSGGGAWPPPPGGRSRDRAGVTTTHCGGGVAVAVADAHDTGPPCPRRGRFRQWRRGADGVEGTVVGMVRGRTQEPSGIFVWRVYPGQTTVASWGLASTHFITVFNQTRTATPHTKKTETKTSARTRCLPPPKPHSARPPPPSRARGGGGYRKRCTIGQLTIMPDEPNAPPSGAVMYPRATCPRYRNSPTSRCRRLAATA